MSGDGFQHNCSILIANIFLDATVRSKLMLRPFFIYFFVENSGKKFTKIKFKCKLI